MKKKRPEKRPSTDEERSRAADAKLKRYITKSALDWAEKEPEVRRQMVAQTLGYKIPDEVEKSRRELINSINELAIKKLKENPKLAQAVAEARIRQVTEEMGLQIEGEEWRRRPLTIDDHIERAKKFGELKEVLGVKERGFWDAITDPQVIVGILSLANDLITAWKSSSTQKALVPVKVDGIDRLVTQEELEQLKAKGKIKYIGSIEPADQNNEEKGDHTTSEPETSNGADEGDGETGAAGSGK